ncbi:restriction endonuclease [Corynebacterium imitans]|uniref:restriction endonuclease n=1 Tax=Corynebacterium imitans TaxID=156978 RepID=UPI001EF1CF44|nr:restriction endonuclease [Corynebacterium imitans]MCG7277865.1 restriction endonuclease [Corynebacterium imitans]
MELPSTQVPTWEQFLIPCLRILSDGTTHQRRAIIEGAAKLLELSPEQRSLTIGSGQQTYLNRAGWAVTHLGKAGAITSPQRAHWKLTDLGKRLLSLYPDGMTESQLLAAAEGDTYQDFLRSRSTQPAKTKPAAQDPGTPLTPIELAKEAQERNEVIVREQILTRLRESDPAFFEKTVLDLLIAMGYGGSLGKATQTRLSNDGGIDGIIDQDALGLSRIYVQAKRHAENNLIGRPLVQAFVGALHGAQANQGVFLTTSGFTDSAKAYAESVQLRVVLIDGDLLSRLMIKHGVGVQIEETIHMVKIDEDHFA